MNYQRLIIRVSAGSLSFSTTDGSQVVYERYPVKSSISIAANMREALRTAPLLQEQYERVLVMVDSPVLMTPADLYSAEEATGLYRYTFSRNESEDRSQETAVSHVLPELNAIAVFAIHRDLHQVLTDRYPQLRLQPVMTHVWNHLHQKSFTGPHQKLYGHFHDHRLEVFCFTQNRFKFCNAFPVGNEPNDALYYLLSVWKQLSMNPREDELHLSGDLPERQQLTDLSRQYVKRVFVNNPSGEFNRAQVTQIEGLPYDLMLQYLRK